MRRVAGNRQRPGGGGGREDRAGGEHESKPEGGRADPRGSRTRLAALPRHDPRKERGEREPDRPHPRSAARGDPRQKDGERGRHANRTSEIVGPRYPLRSSDQQAKPIVSRRKSGGGGAGGQALARA